jgi:sirohydrochlorin ferrochelatase
MTPALVAVAHGSSDPRAVAVLQQLVARVASRRPDLAVRLALLDHAEEHGLADVRTTLAHLAREGRPAVAVPLLLTPAFHARVDLPAVLDAARDVSPGLRVTQAASLGPHPLLVGAAERRVREAGVWPGDPDTAVVLAAAGSSAPDAIEAVHGVAAGWARAGWWDVRAAFASAAGPTVGAAVTALRRGGAPRVVVSSYLLAPGLLPDRVRDQAYEAGAACVTDPLGDADEVARLVLGRYAEASSPRGSLVAAA